MACVPRTTVTDARRVHDSPAPYVSKSKFLWGLQCPELLWQAYNAKELIPEPDAQQQAVFDQGHEVGALAKELYPDGVEVGEDVTDLEETVRLTREALRTRKALFEAAFAANGAYCRTDVLAPAANDGWDIIEVKSTTSVKEVHLHDLAFQTWVLAQAGLTVRRCFLLHINPDFVRHGPVDPKRFFVAVELTDQVNNLTRTVEDALDDQFNVIRQPQHPEVRIGPHCGDPYPCPLQDLCWGFLPKHSMLDLYRGAKKGFGLLDQGVTLLKDIPDDVRLTVSQAIQKATAISGQPHVNHPALAEFLSGLEYPLHFLDFETFGTAIPLFDSVRPYQQIPFQFSLHVVRAPGAKPEHVMFLADGRHDPRPEFMLRLRDAIAHTGSIVAFNAAFELGRLKECCEAMLNFEPWLEGVANRVVDLLNPFRSFHYYHPDQEGSASMKAVLPALTGRGYEGLAIQEGATASLEFLRITFGEVSEVERQRVRRQLEEYCGQDTEGMVWIVDALRAVLQPDAGASTAVLR